MKKYIALLVCCLIGAVIFTGIFHFGRTGSRTVMGGYYAKQSAGIESGKADKEQSEGEEFIRPSKLPLINNRNFNSELYWTYQVMDPSEIVTPEYLIKAPKDTVINYFSILRDSENLTRDKSGGCGTVGNSRLPYPLAYSMLSRYYKDDITYKQYLKSFEGIGHTGLLKLKEIPKEAGHPQDSRYFVEIETIEGSDKGVTYFAYYYGYVNVVKEDKDFKISKLQFYGEDFLCAPMHGWAYNAEANVSIRYGNWCGLIKEQYPTKQNGYVKDIYFKGTDGVDYYIEFFQLTNDTDVEIAQYRKDVNGKWALIHLEPEKCLDKQKHK